MSEKVYDNGIGNRVMRQKNRRSVHEKVSGCLGSNTDGFLRQFLYDQNGLMTKWLVEIFPGMNRQWFTGFNAALFTMTFACTSNYALFLRNAIRGIDCNTVDSRDLGERPAIRERRKKRLQRISRSPGLSGAASEAAEVHID